MKKLTLSAVALVFTLMLFSQNYYPLVQENNEWNVLQVIFEGGNPWDTSFYTQTYKISGDTIVNNQDFKKIYKSEEEIPVNWIYEGSIREEDEKVWYVSHFNNEERLIYDFTLNVGDTMEFQDQPYMVVDSITFHEIAGIERKHIYFSYIDFSPYKELWIEGIGSNYGVLSSGSGGSVGGWTWFLCMSENGELIYMNPDYNSCFLIGTKINETKSLDFNIFPNPTTGLLKIEKLNNVTINSIRLVDLYGQTKKTFENNQTFLDLTEIAPGLYMLIIDTENELLKKKIIIK